MKLLSRILCAGMLIALISGCASNGPYVPELSPTAKAMYMDYQAKPMNKVFVVAMDPCGDYAVGYASGKATTKEAYRIALKQCLENSKKWDVLAEPHIYAINDEVVYEEAIIKSQKK